MRAVALAVMAFAAMTTAAAAQHCNLRCICADPAQDVKTCPNVSAEECTQAARNGSVGGVACTGTMAASCQASNHVPTPPGDYAQTCEDCQHDCTFLTCSCRTTAGRPNRTGIVYSACPGHAVTNVDGRLTCGG